MKCVVLVYLLLQAVYAEKNNTLSVEVPHENPADVSYVNGKAPEDLKAGPARSTSTGKPKEIIAQAAFIRSSNREIPKDDEIENEEFERFIQKYHSRPTIETVFVSTSPSPPAEDSELLPETDDIKETNTTEAQVEVFNRPSAKLQAFQRSVAHPTLTSHILPGPDHHPSFTILSHEPHDASLHHGGSASFVGSDGYVFQSHGGAAGNEGFILQSHGGGHDGGQIFITDAHGGGAGGDQHYYQYADFIPRTFNVAQNAVKTKTYEIRRPAIQKHYYDIEERVIVRPAGSVIVELDRPVAKVPTGETVVAVGGLTGSFVGNGFQQSSQGGISFGNAFGGSQGGLVGIQQSGGGFGYSQGGSGITYASSVGIPSQGGGSISGIGIQQSQGAIGGGIQQSQSGIAISTTTPSPLGSPSTTVVVGTQQQQGAAGGAGFQQSQSGISVTTTPAPGTPSTTASVGIQQSQGGVSGGGFQQSQGGISISTTPGPGYNTQTSSVGGFQQSQGGGGYYSTTGTPFFQSTTPSSIGGGIGIQQSQGGIGISQGGGITGGFQQSQGGGVYSTTGTPFFQSTTPSSIGVGIGIQQSQGGIGISQGGISGAGFQQSQGGGVYSTTGTPFFQSSTPSSIGVGFQQSQGGIGISQGGGIAGGFQQSQGGIYSTTPAPYLPPPSPTPTILIGRSKGGYSGGNFVGGGYSGGIGGSFGGGEILYSTTQSPSYSISGSRSILLRPQHSGGYPVVSTTTGVPIIVSSLDNHGGNSFILQGNTNVQSKGSVSSTTTTERSFSVSQDASAFARGQSSGHVDFSYPSYVEISSNGSPLGHLMHQSYVQAPSSQYPRMRYQGQLLTGEIRAEETPEEQKESHKQGYGALSSHHQNYNENPAYIAEIPTSSPLEEHKQTSSQQLSESQQHQFAGSSKQPIQDTQISSSAHQQPDQHYFLRAVSQPIVVSAHNNVEQHTAPQPSSHSYQQFHPHHGHQQHYFVAESQPQQSRSYQQYSDLKFIPVATSHHSQQHESGLNYQHKQPAHHNLVAQIRHQQQQAPKHQFQDLTSLNQPTEKSQHVPEALEESLEVSEVQSSTHQQPTLFQQQVTPTLKTLEPYTSGKRQYQQHVAPSKYTQDQSLNVEIPSEPQYHAAKEPTTESSNLPYVASSTTSPAAKQQIEDTPQSQHQTYASVLAQSNPGILYAPPSPVVTHHSHGHKQHFLRFSADGSSLFSPSGRRLHLVYADQPRPIYPHQSQVLQHPIPTTVPVEPAKQHSAESNANKGYQIQAQLPITRQSQIELSASNIKPAPVSEQPQIARSQSHAESHRTSARYEAISSTTPETATAAASTTITTATKEHHHHRQHQQKLRAGPQKYRNEQTHGAITLRSGHTYGDHRVIASTPAPNDGGAASESVQTRRIVVNHPFQTVQEIVEREPFTNIHQVTVNAPAKQVLHSETQHHGVVDGLQEGQQKSAALRAPNPYKIVAQVNHPRAALSFHHGGSH